MNRGIAAPFVEYGDNNGKPTEETEPTEPDGATKRRGIAAFVRLERPKKRTESKTGRAGRANARNRKSSERRLTNLTLLTALFAKNNVSGRKNPVDTFSYLLAEEKTRLEENENRRNDFDFIDFNDYDVGKTNKR